MPDVLVRDVEVEVIEKLKLRAKRQNRSFQAEMKLLMKNTASKPDALTRLEHLRAFRDSLGPQKTDSAVLLREDRDR